MGLIVATSENQVRHLTAIQDRLGGWLAFWAYLLLDDLNMESISEVMRAQGRADSDLNGLLIFAPIGLWTSDGNPKPPLGT